MELHGHALSAGWSDASWDSVWVCVCSRMCLKEIWQFLSSTLTLQSDGISLTLQWPDGFPTSVVCIKKKKIETRAGRLIETEIRILYLISFSHISLIPIFQSCEYFPQGCQVCETKQARLLFKTSFPPFFYIKTEMWLFFIRRFHFKRCVLWFQLFEIFINNHK